MKTAAVFFSGLVMAAFLSGPASAEVVRVRLTARVDQINDPNNRLAGKVAIGQRVNGLYFYNTNTPNQSPSPSSGEYLPYANEARVRFAIGTLVYESQQPTQGIGILTSDVGDLSIFSNDNKDLADGTNVNTIWMDITGPSNFPPIPSVALPKTAPNLQQYNTKEVTIGAGDYSIRAQLEVAELVVSNAVVVSPASGTFAANQHFDAAVILPRNSVVQNAHAMANGQLLPLTYPGSCQLQPQVGTGRPSLLCPGADAVLSIQPGAPIEWTVELTNGTIYTETVNWERAP
jgi:hypothetical protein